MRMRMRARVKINYLVMTSHIVTDNSARNFIMRVYGNVLSGLTGHRASFQGFPSNS